MSEKQPKGPWLVEGILASLLFGVGVLADNIDHLNRFIAGVLVVFYVAFVLWVFFKYLRIRKKQKSV